MKVVSHGVMVATPLDYHPVVNIPDEYWVFDFSRGPQSDFQNPYEFSIGKYDETRPGMYTTPLFEGERNHHVGLDIGAPAGTEVFAFAEGSIYSFGINAEDGSYGPTIITEHKVSLPISVGSSQQSPPQTIWVLHGHLRLDSLDGLVIGQKFPAGHRLAFIGSEKENGGWPPHLHLQLSLKEPNGYDLPGVVTQEERIQALKDFPDPRLILGNIY
jgi:murein DD-endopeptidase MepM/ murein hydrolase activator NlpD